MEQTNPPSLRESAQNLVAYLRQNMAVMDQELFDRLLAVERAIKRDNRSSTVEELHGRATKAQKKVADLEQKLADECATSDALRKQLEDANARVSAAHKTLAACLRPETQTGTLAGDAARLVKAVQGDCEQILRVMQPMDGRSILERDLPKVVDELLDLRSAFRAQGRAEKAEAELTQVREAIGLLTTLHPMLEVDVRDPVGMAQKIVEKISCERSNADLDHRAVFDIGRALEGVEFGGCNSIESTVRAAREVLPTIAALRNTIASERAQFGAAMEKVVDQDVAAALGSAGPRDVHHNCRCALGPVSGAKVASVRDPATGWTFDKFRRELEVARTTAKGNAGLFAQALRELEAAKGGA